MRWQAAWCALLVWCGAARAAGPRCARDLPQRCAELGSSRDEYFYQIRGNISLVITFSEAQYFHLACPAGVALDDPALPALPHAAVVALVRLVACAPPPRGYAHALLALNVSLAGALQLSAQPAAPPLSAARLAGLRLTGLELEPPRADAPLRVQPDLLAALSALRDLRLRRVALPAAALLDLPRTLRSLTLEHVAGPSPSAAALTRLLELERLTVYDDALNELDLGATTVREVIAGAPLRGVTLGARLVNLTLKHALDAELRGDCAALRRVTLVNLTSALPVRWLARCPGVRELFVYHSRGALGGDELAGARALLVLEARYCGLRELPERWLADAGALRSLNLSDNLLERLPSLAASPELAEVWACSNRLSPGALAPLAALPALSALALDRNPTLRDLCGHGDTYVAAVLSPLAGARGLRALRLRRTGVSGVCRDWRLDLSQLAELDLRDNNITSLTREELQWRRAVPAAVDLRGNAVHVDWTPDDYRAALRERARADPRAPVTTLILDNVVDCDCHDYWFARAWRERAGDATVALQSLRCRGDEPDATRDLLDVPLDELLCDVPEGCPRGCRCRASPAGAELRCERAGLDAVPRMRDPAPPVRALLLAGNNITRVRAADVPPSLRLLDLRDNRVVALDAGAAAALWDARERSVLLAGNPLDCSCAALPLLQALASAPHRVQDLPAAQCAGGRALPDAAARAAAECAALPLWPALLAALALAALSALAAACLMRPAARHRFKRFLFERGLCLRWVLRGTRADDEEAREYDAFVSFSHLDQRYADELARRLERGAGARRLCLHERDWVPGEWIPTQIARSVRRARRTLVLLSDHFLASTWARAELREAYAAALDDQRPRLLLLLLPGLAAERAAAADPALRAYLSRVTYLRWDDPHFWRKLDLALPPARRAPPPPREAPRPPAPPPPP